MLSIKSNSAKSIRVDAEISQLGDPVVLEDVQKLVTSKSEAASIHELASLTLQDEQNASSVEKVTLLEKTSPPPAETQDHNGEKVIEGLEFLHMGDSLDDNGIWEKLEGMKVEIIKPSNKSAQSVGQMPTEREAGSSGNDAAEEASSSKVSPPAGSQHKLFSPAFQTLSMLEERAGISRTDLRDVKTGKGVELNPDAKVFLLRRLSLSRPVVTPS